MDDTNKTVLQINGHWPDLFIVAHPPAGSDHGGTPDCKGWILGIHQFHRGPEGRLLYRLLRGLSQVRIANYLDWKYQYVPCTWTESLEELKTGEIDLVCSAQYTEERAKSYDYCRYSMGTESTILYVRPDDHSIYYNDYQAMNDKEGGDDQRLLSE